MTSAIDLARALEGFNTASMDACNAAMAICGASPWAMQIADEARRNGELLERAMWLTGKIAKEIRALAAESPLCFADFVTAPALPTPGVGGPLVTTPGPSPFVPQPPALPNPTRFRVRMGVCYCTICDLAVAYCRGHAPPDAQSTDGADTSLRDRIAECKGK